MAYDSARYYDPTLGRFISADTIVPGAGSLTVSPHDPVAAGAWSQRSGGPADPQQLNRYSYVLNNPIRNVDPTGHCGGITDMPGDCPGENKDAWIAGGRAIGGGGSSSGGGGSSISPFAWMFLQESLKELGAAAMGNPIIRGAIAGGVGNGLSTIIQESLSGASPRQILTDAGNSMFAGAVGGGTGVVRGPLAGITATALTNSVLKGSVPQGAAENFLSETYSSLSIGLVSGSLPMGVELGAVAIGNIAGNALLAGTKWLSHVTGGDRPEPSREPLKPRISR